MSKIIFILFACLVTTFFVVRAGGQTVTVQSPITWQKIKVDNAEMNRRIDAAAEQYKEFAPIPRIAFYDIGYPKDKPEFGELNGHGVLLVSSLTQDERELPLKRVYVLNNKKEVELKLIKSVFIREPLSNSGDLKTFGPFRTDSLYLFPVYLNKSGAELVIDFSINRVGMKIASLAGRLPPELQRLRDSAPADGKNIDQALRLFIKREFPGYLDNR